jgi:hypothetical protein
VRRPEAEADIPIWKEALFGADLILLHASPVYYGLGVPHGDGSAVVVIPGFLGSDVWALDCRGAIESDGRSFSFHKEQSWLWLLTVNLPPLSY